MRSEETLFVNAKHRIVSDKIPTEDESSYWTRSMIKKKNTDFNEVVTVLDAPQKTKTWSSTTVADLHTTMLTYINKPRAMSVRSKMTDSEASDRRKFAEALLVDAIKDAGYVWNQLTQAEKTELTKALMSVAFKIVAVC